MKVELIEATRKDRAAKAAPWATIIVKVQGGYMAFESITDYEIWRKQA